MIIYDEHIPDEIVPYIQMAQIVSKMDYQGIYIVDMKRRKTVCATDNPLVLCGLSNQAIEEHGFPFYTNVIRDEEAPIVRAMVASLKDFYYGIPEQLRDQVVLYVSFHINNGGLQVMVTHKLSMLHVGGDKRPRLLLGMVSPSVYGSFVIHGGVVGTDHFFRFDPTQKAWVNVMPYQLTSGEIRMLHLTAQGLSIEQIAALMFRSPCTIKYYRRQIFKKLGVRNTSEAIAHAVNYCLI